jgi:hypothetical protein
MDTRIFKKLIKEAVKEAIQEEMKDILLEAVRAPKPVLQENYAPTVLPGTPIPNAREKYRELLGDMMDSRNGNLSMRANQALGFGQQVGYTPSPSTNTATEGSSLPAGEVNLNQIMGLMNKK